MNCTDLQAWTGIVAIIASAVASIGVLGVLALMIIRD
jgi:hypothetical protein